jgi:phospholipid/cholesterol/gamma-HCH transport system permease protein
MIAARIAELGTFGRELIHLTLSLLGLSATSLRSVPVIFSSSKGPVFWLLFFRNFRQAGIESLGFVCAFSALLGFFVLGRSLTFTTAAANYADYYAEVFVVIVLREIGPLLCGILLIARSGVAVTTEIGYLKLNQEFEVLKSIGVEPRHMFLMPVFFAFPLSLLCSFLMFFVTSLVVSNLALVVYSSSLIQVEELLTLIMLKIDLLEIVVVVCKAALGGVIVGLIALHFGSEVGNRFTDISRALKRATTYQVIAYLLISVLLSTVLYL